MARAVFAAALLSLAPAALARIHSLNIEDDPRAVFSIESFGFMDGGSVDLDIHDVSVKPEGAEAQMGFVIYPAVTEAAVNEHIDALLAAGECALDKPPPGSSTIDLSKKSTWKDYKNSYEVFGTGMFNILFTRCLPAGSDASVSFTMEAAFVNPGPNYLSAGDMPLPAIYTVMSVAFGVAFAVWVRYLRAHKAETTRIHQLMAILLLVKVRVPPPGPFFVMSLPPRPPAPRTAHSPPLPLVFFSLSFLCARACRRWTWRSRRACTTTSPPRATTAPGTPCSTCSPLSRAASWRW